MRVLAKVIAPLRRRWRPVSVLLLCALTGMALAQSGGDDSAADPPGRVARLSYITGELGFLPAGAQEWSDASINRPLTTGDRLSSGQDARAELELDGATLRIDGQTDFGLLDLNDQLAQLELTQGTLNLSVRQLDQGQSYEIDTPTIALVVDQPGTFRVDIDDDGSTQVTAFDGSATVYGENNAQRAIDPGRSYRINDANLSAIAINQLDGGDAFDAWCSDRDRRYAQTTSSQYVSADVVGAQDLDQYGDWETSDDYGAVWYPSNVGSDWAPYRDGHWAYIGPWGWSWVDDSRWGFAPYHYGRWAYTHRGWGWIPGPRGVRSIYAPALVAFVGGGGWAAGVGGPVGWFPLGPGEIYNPWYHASRRYYSNLNLGDLRGYRGHDRSTIARSIDNHYNSYRNGSPPRGEHYANRDAPRGFTAIPGRSFAGGQHVQRDLLHIDRHQLATSSVLPRGTNLRPAAGSLVPVRGAHARALPTNGFNREVVARHAPPVQSSGRRFDPTTRLAGAQRASTYGASVRVLNAAGPADQAGSNRLGNPRGTAGNSRRPFGTPGSPSRNLPPTSNVAAGTPTDMQNRDPVRLRQGELPSARFAHPPSDRNAAGQREPMPRPGVSYISNAGDNQPRTIYRGPQTLPQVPQIQRATPINSPLPSNDGRSPRYETARSTPNDVPPVRDDTRTPRFERAGNAPRADVREQPRAMPEPVRQDYQPRYQQQPRAAPQYVQQPPRAEMVRPQREAAPRPAAAPRERAANKNEQQH